MVVYYLKNTLNPDEVVVPVTVDIRLVQDSPVADGEDIWVLDFNTNIKDLNGNKIPTHTIQLRGSSTTVEEAIEEGLAWIGDRIDWGTLYPDTAKPYVSFYLPTETTNVSIASPVQFIISDYFPSLGIDPSSITLKVNDIDVTDQLTVDSYAAYTRVVWNHVTIV